MSARLVALRGFPGALAVVFAALALAICAPAAADAATITVDSTADEADAAPGGACLSASGKCTLRAAIEVANASTEGSDEVVFSAVVFDGQPDSTIVLGSNLPHVVEPVRIDGGECMTAMGVSGPCAAIEGTNQLADGALTIEVDGVEVEDLAFVSASIGIEIDAEEFTVVDNWFSVRLDGSIESSVVPVGVRLPPGSGSGRVGGAQSGEGNFFPFGGIEMFGASHVQVLGNTFGLTPDGEDTPFSTAGQPLTIAAAPLAGFGAVGNEIGTRLSPKAAATPACDGGCNLFSDVSLGVGIGGQGPTEGPPIDTTVRGNNFGLDLSGTKVVGINSAIGAGGIGTEVGGPAVGDANRINGAGTPINGGGQGGLVIEGNLIGVDVTATEVLGPSSDGVTLYSGGLTGPDDESTVVDNVIAVQSSANGIAVNGLGATVVGNEVIGGWIGIFTTDDNDGHGSLIEGNLVADAEGVGVAIENENNELFGNEILGTTGVGENLGGVGIGIYARNKRTTSGTLVGGDTPASENLISYNRADAISIYGVDATVIEVGRNRGQENGGQFLTIAPYSPQFEPTGPNGGIEPPQIGAATTSAASGSAEPGALVRVFRKATSDPGEIASFLGEAVADIDGKWSLAYAGSIPGGTPIAATQTKEGGSSELGFAATPGGGDGGGNPPPQPDTTAPRARIVKAPGKRGRSRTVAFRFTSEPGARFQCKLDGRPFRACSSPVRYRKLALGQHRFAVRAVDAVGNVGAATARAFAILPRR